MKNENFQPPQEHWVIVLGWLAMGGAERQALYFASFLKEKRNAKVTVVGLEAPGAVIDECRILNIDCHYFNISLPRRIDKLISVLFKFIVQMRHLEPTYIAPYCMPPNLLCGVTWRLTGAKACVWQQRDEGLMRRADWLEWLALKLTPRFISNSQHGSHWLVNNLGVNKKSIHIVRNGVKVYPYPSEEKSWRKKWAVPKEKLLITMVGNIHANKDHRTLIRAWDLLQENVLGKNCVLFLAGSYSDAYGELNDYIKERQLGDSVFFTGSINDVHELLNDADLLVHSSVSEGVPNAILEGMERGMAVVATDIPGIREALGSETDFQIVRPSDPRDLSEKLLALLGNRELRVYLGERNRQRVLSLYSIDQMGNETILAFKSS